ATSNSRSPGRIRAATSPPRLYSVSSTSRLRGQRAHAVRRLHLGAGARLHELPRITLIIRLGRACAGRARTGLAVVLASERHAVAFFHARLAFVGSVNRGGEGESQGGRDGGRGFDHGMSSEVCWGCKPPYVGCGRLVTGARLAQAVTETARVPYER